MGKAEETVEGTVCKSFLHNGEDCPRGTDLDLPVGTARMLENSKRFTTDKDERARVKRAAKAASVSRSGGADPRLKEAERAIDEVLDRLDSETKRADEADKRADSETKRADEAEARVKVLEDEAAKAAAKAAKAPKGS